MTNIIPYTFLSMAALVDYPEGREGGSAQSTSSEISWALIGAIYSQCAYSSGQEAMPLWGNGDLYGLDACTVWSPNGLNWKKSIKVS